ncbi:MAG: hypothetical protein SPL79_09705 [Sphaerochaetaceae bacterium]|jgi:hypothetical protein|nr:hypothetical protein [Sphaerochaetaceae bacterium]
MKKLFFRHLCLILQSLTTLAFCVLIVYGAYSALEEGVPLFAISLRFGPSFAHLVISLVLAVMVYHYLRTTFGSDAQLMPFLLLLLSLLELRVYPVCYLYTQTLSFSMSQTARLYQIILLAAILISMECMLYQTEINVKRINTGILIACAVSLLVGMAVPLSPNTATFLEGAYIGALTMRGAVCILGGIGLAILFCSVFQENVSKETIIKCVAYTMHIVALVLLAFPYGMIRDGIALLLELASLVILVLVARSRRIWA